LYWVCSARHSNQRLYGRVAPSLLRIMGLYDREYYREEPRGMSLSSDMSATTTLILINAAVFIADMFSNNKLVGYLGLGSDLVTDPKYFWQLLTYGFAHDPSSVRHVLFNMFALWLFGRDVETIYGKRLYVQLYLSLVVLSGLVWLAINVLAGHGPALLIGASGAVTGIMILYVLHYPTRTLLFWGVFPIPVWVIGTLQLLQDIQGAVSRPEAGNVAYTAHLAGAAFAFIFYRTGWQLGSFLPKRFSLGRLKPKPRLRVHNVDEDEEDDLGRRVDRILEKINREGQDSLTREEKRTLERASRRYQQKRR
jgi:membrane associated rhomboid family serine protease